MTVPRRDWREARLKPEFSHPYPYLTADEWQMAWVLANRVATWRLRESEAGYMPGARLLDPEHFDFRGGEPRRSGEGSLRTRAEDR